MSLIYRLPLRDDLKNYGLYDATATGHNLTTRTDGKVGKCQSFGKSMSLAALTNSSGAVITNSSGETVEITSSETMVTNSYIGIDKEIVEKLSEDFSFTLWLRIDQWATAYETYVYGGKGNSPWADYIFGLLRNNTANSVVFVIGNGSSTTNTNCASGTLTAGKWYHMACTYMSGTMRLYIDGTLAKEYATTVSPDFGEVGVFNLGTLNSVGTYQTNSSVNDFRLYNHCLSPMEVKQISQGLILHYPLNRGGWGQENLVVNYRNSGNAGYYSTTLSAQVYEVDSSMPSGYHQKCTIGTASGTGGPYWVGTTTNGNTGTQISQLIADAWYTVSYYIKGTTTHSGVISTTAEFLKNITFVERPTINTGWQRVTFYGQYNGNTTSNIAITIYEGSKWTAGEVFYFSSLKVEPGKIRTQWTPHSSDILYITMGLDGTIEYDCSGFCNNANSNGSVSLTYSSDTPKYNVSTVFASGARIATPISASTFLPTDVITVSIWFKSTNAANRFLSCTEGGGFNFESASGKISFPIYITGKGYTRVDGNTTWSEVSDNKWHMITATYDKQNTILYIDGQLDKSTVSSYPNIDIGYSTVTPFTLGAEAQTIASPIAGTYVGNLSDCRIYATALSADDVLSLYQNSAYIDSSGNVYGAVHSEV